MAGMKFIEYHWNRLEKGSTVVVSLSTAANVRLMDSTNFNSYKHGRRHRFKGGLVKQTPFRISVPSSGTWYLTIDLAGLKATSVRHAATVESPPLPTATSAPLDSLSGVQHERAPVIPDDNGETWDVFVSHASEDKEAIAEPLAVELRARGLKVWLDKTELRIGDSLRRKIDYGLAHSTFGVVILSKSFLIEPRRSGANLRRAGRRIYALASATSGQSPPPQAERLQYPICSTREEFKKQVKRLSMLPGHVVEALERSQPYQSPDGPETNLTYWVHELGRRDRHRSLHIGMGRVEKHHIKVAAPTGVKIQFDEAVTPYSHIDGELLLARFTASQPIRPKDIKADLRGVEIAPEIQGWAQFSLGGRSYSLEDRMVYTEFFTLNHLENLSLMGGVVPSRGFRTLVS